MHGARELEYLYSAVLNQGFPSGSAGKESVCNAGDLGLIRGLGRSPREGNGYPLQYSGLENSMDCIVYGVAKSWTGLSDFHWNARSMNQGKLEVVKQAMTRVNINILGISELMWTGIGEFGSDEHYIYYCGQESLIRNGIAIMVNKRVQNAVLGCNLKNDTMISVRVQGKPFISQ